MWTIGHWGIGVSWIIVSVYYYGNIGYIASSIVYMLFLILILLFAVAPIRLFKIKKEYPLNLHSALYISSVFILLELSRDFYFGGFPWLVPGTVGIDTILSMAFPLIGVAGASFIIYLLSAVIAMSWNNNRKTSYVFLALSFLILIPSNPHTEEADETRLKISLVQPSLDPQLKFKRGYKTEIEGALLTLTNKIQNESDLIIWPEVELPYSYNSKQFKELKNKINPSTELITGIWHFEENKLYNSLISIKSDEIYKKRHLVPFGEYIPFKSILKPLLNYFGAPISDISPGRSNQELISINNDIKAAPLICYDIVFANDVRKAVKSSDFIINISNDSWFGGSLGPYQHLEIARIRAIENNRWIARSTNDGYTAFINNKGTIVSLMPKYQQGSLTNEISLIKSSTIYSEYGYYVTYLFSIIYIFITLSLYLWSKLRN